MRLERKQDIDASKQDIESRKQDIVLSKQDIQGRKQDIEILSVCIRVEIMLHYYLDQRLVNSLLGKNDFAICFFTSEYLFQTYCEQKNFDYTSIVAGYLKSVEQLVHTILKALMNDEQHNRAILIKRRTINSNNYPESIRNATVKLPIGKGDKYINLLPLDPMYEDYFDTTLNSMCNCLFSYADGWRVSKKSTILHFLQLFSADCRNDHFHKHNITNWDEVTRIRNNVRKSPDDSLPDNLSGSELRANMARS